MVVTSVFYFGHLFRTFGARLALKPAYALLCFLFLAAASTYGAIDTGGHIFVSPLFYLSCSLCGVYLHLTLARSVPEGLVKKFLVHTGRNTITILALHFLAFRGVNYLLVRIYDLPPYMTGQHHKIDATGGWWALYLVAGVMLPLAVRAVYDRIQQATARKPSVTAAT
jgi:fucose 4-O-acetylase-like acetyltransferase